MNKHLFAVLSFGLLAAALLFTSALSEALPSSSPAKTVEAFENIDVSVKAADILIVPGSAYSVAYSLNERETLDRLEVADGTLYVKTSVKPNFNMDFGDWSVVITVPQDAPLKTLKLAATAGDIELENRVFESGELETTAGEIELNNLTCDSLTAKTVSEDIELENSQVGNVKMESTAGDISLSGAFDTVALQTVSSECELEGTVAQSMKAETVSGDIEIKASVGAIEAKTFGSIVYDGARQGFKFKLNGDAPSFKLVSVSGDIEISTEKHAN